MGGVETLVLVLFTAYGFSGSAHLRWSFALNRLSRFFFDEFDVFIVSEFSAIFSSSILRISFADRRHFGEFSLLNRDCRSKASYRIKLVVEGS